MKKNRTPAVGIRVALASVPVLIMLSACASLGAAQAEKGSRLAEKVEGRKKVQLFTSEGKIQVLSPTIGADGLEGRAPDSGLPVRYSWPEIQSIQVRKSGTSRGLAIGAGSGFAMGLAAGAILLKASEGDFEDSIVPLGGAAGAAAGALIGAMIGSVSSSWRTVYLANDASRPVPMISLAPARGGGLAVTLAVGF